VISVGFENTGAAPGVVAGACAAAVGAAVGAAVVADGWVGAAVAGGATVAGRLVGATAAGGATVAGGLVGSTTVGAAAALHAASASTAGRVVTLRRRIGLLMRGFPRRSRRYVRSDISVPLFERQRLSACDQAPLLDRERALHAALIVIGEGTQIDIAAWGRRIE
jgi:hypothetical protein